MKKSVIIALVIIIIGYGVYAYVTRPVATPTVDVNSQVEHLAPAEEQSASGEKVMKIDSSNSKAEFSLNEELNGKPTLVIGTTKEIAGDIKIKTSAPAAMTIGEVKVDARTLKTDNEKRNGAIARMILKSEEKGNEYITFKATAVTGLPNTIETGKEWSYSIAGNLTIRGTTKPATFTGKGTLNADGSFTSTASTTVTYKDYGISVPDFPFLANVEDTTKLSVSIVAK